MNAPQLDPTFTVRTLDARVRGLRRTVTGAALELRRLREAIEQAADELRAGRPDEALEVLERTIEPPEAA